LKKSIIFGIGRQPLGWSVSSFESKQIYLVDSTHPLTGYRQRSRGLQSLLSSLPVLALFRIIRRWNQTGQKFAGEPDIGRYFLPSHPWILWSLMLAMSISTFVRLTKFQLMPKYLTRPLVATAISLVFLFKVCFTSADSPELMSVYATSFDIISSKVSLVVQARLAFMAIFMLLILPLIYSYKVLGMQRDLPAWYHQVLSLFLIMQSRATNIPLFFLFSLQSDFLGLLNLSPDEINITELLFLFVSFFAFGGTNAISSVDLSNAYNGINEFNVLAVGVLTFVGNWAGPIWWSSAARVLSGVSGADAKSRKPFQRLSFMSAFFSIASSSVMLACAILRSHLFIWTVFSPKFLYNMAWCLGQHLLVNFVFEAWSTFALTA
jgi:ethanolaminephosphotransferase